MLNDLQLEKIMHMADSLKHDQEYTWEQIVELDWDFPYCEVDAFDMFLRMESVPSYNLLLALVTAAGASIWNMNRMQGVSRDGDPKFNAVRAHLRKHCLEQRRSLTT